MHGSSSALCSITYLLHIYNAQRMYIYIHASIIISVPRSTMHNSALYQHCCLPLFYALFCREWNIKSAADSLLIKFRSPEYRCCAIIRTKPGQSFTDKTSTFIPRGHTHPRAPPYRPCTVRRWAFFNTFFFFSLSTTTLLQTILILILLVLEIKEAGVH